jgi:hypothetical protein
MTHPPLPARTGEQAPQESLGKRRGIALKISDIYIEILYIIKITSLNLSDFVARQISRRCGVSPHRYRADRLQRRAPLRCLLVPIDTTFDLLLGFYQFMRPFGVATPFSGDLLAFFDSFLVRLPGGQAVQNATHGYPDSLPTGPLTARAGDPTGPSPAVRRPPRSLSTATRRVRTH